MAKTHWGGQFSLVCQYRETHHQPFIRMASQPLLNLTSSHSPLNTHTDTFTHSFTPRPHPSHMHKARKTEKKRKQNSCLNIIIKHINAIFSGMPLMRKNKAGGLDSSLEKGSLDDTTTPTGSDPVPPRQAMASGTPRPFPRCGPRFVVLVGGRRESALLSSHYKQDMTCDYKTTGKISFTTSLCSCLAPSLYRVVG